MNGIENELASDELRYRSVYKEKVMEKLGSSAKNILRLHPRTGNTYIESGLDGLIVNSGVDAHGGG